MIDFDPFVLLLVMTFSVFSLASAWLFCKSNTQRLLLIPSILGFVFYHGIAVSSETIPIYMAAGYPVFIIALIVGFRFGAFLNYPVGKVISINAAPVLEKFAEGFAAKCIIFLFFFLMIITLLVPTFKLQLLFLPPSPDLRASFDARFTGDRNLLVSLVGIITALITPLYYLALYRYRHRIVALFFLLFAPLYITYVGDAYIGRYTILFALIVFFAMVWSCRPKWRWALVISALVIVPILGVIARNYTYARLGAAAPDSGIIEALTALIDAETMLPIITGVPLVESGERADLAAYFLWLLTLPIPGVFKGGLPILLLNYEISEIVLRVTRDSPQFYVVLPGLLAESIYLFGRVFFFIHPLTIGFVMGAFAAILQNIPRVGALLYYLAALFMLNLNRGGVASVAPEIINGFLLFALIVFVAVLREQRHRKNLRPLRVKR